MLETHDHDYTSPDFKVATFLFHARVYAIISGAPLETATLLANIEMGLRFHEGAQ